MKDKHFTQRYLRTLLVIGLVTSGGWAEVLYVDGRTGHDTNPGTQAAPLKTIEQAANLVNKSNAPGSATLIIAPGIYSQSHCVTFASDRDFTETDRLTIRASMLPDDPNWMPGLMPVIVSIEDPRQPGRPGQVTETVNIKIAISHVTMQGLKFLGNPTLNNMHACVERIGKELDDLLIKQCVFAGDRYGADIYAATLATGDRFVVDHCIFRGCGASVVYWDGPDQVGGRGCAMRHCIVDRVYQSGPWTCQTAEDFQFHHNVVTNSEYVWVRKPGDRQKYRVHHCAVVGNKHFSGYGVASGPMGETGDEVSFEETELVKNGAVVYETMERSRDYLHVAEGSTGHDLGAGLFTRRDEQGKP